MPIIERAVTRYIFEDMRAFPAVYVNGPRQSGKTTLVRELIASKFNQASYVTFDDVLERAAAARNPEAYLEQVGYPLVIDEVQMVQEIFRPLKKAIDESRLKNLRSGRHKPNGRYLLTGSTNLAAMPKLADAMVGRMGIRTLYPLSAAEYWDTEGDFIQRAFARDFPAADQAKRRLMDALHVASFPELVGMKSAQVKSWFENYIRQVTLEDPRQIYNLEKAEFMLLLLQALASRAGNLINDADLSRDIGLSTITTRTYRNLLQATFITFYLHPWHRNVSKRLVKASKGYFYDTQLLCHMLQRSPEELAAHDPGRFGHVLENFVATELIKLINNSDSGHNLLFYRTRDGKKVDFVVESPHGSLIGIEIKNAENVTERDFSGLKELQSLAKKDFICGIVLCNTPRPLPFGDNIFLVPFSALWQ
jgi:predicted AAA+ superfamily ATPase